MRATLDDTLVERSTTQRKRHDGQGRTKTTEAKLTKLKMKILVKTNLMPYIRRLKKTLSDSNLACRHTVNTVHHSLK